MPDTYNVPHAGMYNVAPAMPDYTPVDPPAYEPPAVDPATMAAMINQGDAYEPSPDMYNDNHRAFENAVMMAARDYGLDLASLMIPQLRAAAGVKRALDWGLLRSIPPREKQPQNPMYDYSGEVLYRGADETRSPFAIEADSPFALKDPAFRKDVPGLIYHDPRRPNIF